jgi:hypothetical protein
VPEVLWVVGLLLLFGAVGAVQLVPWVTLIQIGNALMLDSAALGVPLELVYYALLGGILTWTGQRPNGWYWRPFLHHHLLSRGQKLLVLPWFFAGALSFLSITLGIAVALLGMLAAAVQAR